VASRGGVKVLLTEGSSSSARQTLYGLDRYTVDILDPSPWCQCRFSRLVRRWYRCPSFSQSPGAYLRFLADRILKGHYDVLFPTHEQVYLLARFRDALQRRVGVALPSFEALEQMQCKSSFARLLQRLGLPAPETQVIRNPAELAPATGFPCYLKLAHSTAGYGVRLVQDAEDLRNALADFEREGALAEESEVVVQQPARGIQGVAQSVFQHGRLIAAHCSEAHDVGIGGGQMLRVSASHPMVIADLQKLGAHLHWHGALFVDYFYDAERERVQYIEANPRIGETLSARICGVNLCDLLVQISLGNQMEPVGPTEAGVWSHNGFQVLLARALKGAGRRELIAECWRLIRKKGPYRGCQNEMTRPAEDWASLIPAFVVTFGLFANPRLADRIVRRTVENYSLPETAVQSIHELPADLAEDFFRELAC